MTVAARPTVPAPPTHDAADLAVLRALFERLHADGVVYCHWKSNEHLGASMRGSADLDLLVRRSAEPSFVGALVDLGFKRFAAVPGRAYPGVEDWLGFDADSGALAHLHVHYELTLGEPHLKGYRIPWEDALLSRRVLDEEHGVYRADPAAELLLLHVRAALKLRWRDHLTRGRREAALPAGMHRELQWLVERVDEEEFSALARRLAGADAAELLREMMASGEPTRRDVRALRARMRDTLRAWRTYSAAGARVRRWWRELHSRLGPLARRAGLSEAPSRRVLPRGGVVIAFVGADGSGKSTLVREIGTWLGWKLDVMRVYGGSGKGSAGLPRRVLEGGAALVRRATRRRTRGAPVAGGADTYVVTSTRPGIGRLAWITALSRERRQRAGQARRARNRGMVVLADRLPQSQFAGLNDGPRLGAFVDDPAPLLRAAARCERAAFRAVEHAAPDLVVRLLVGYDVAARRKPDTPPDQLRRKLEIIRLLHFPPGVRVVDVDAGRPLAEVLLAVKRAVWEAL